jgi:parvulin-like peptidyl-prolyl isomerase
MNIIFKILLISLLSTLTLISSEIVAQVNGKKITRNDIDTFIAKSIPGARYSSMSFKQKRKVVDQLVDRALYIEVAKQEGIENDIAYQTALIKVQENLMLDIWMKKRLDAILIDEREIRDYYQKHTHKFYQEAAASARHILVSTESEAKEIIKELQRSRNLKERFIQLAHERSTGPSSKNGGDLGWFSQDQMVPEFSNAALALNIGEITTTPVKTHFGYHIIYLTDKRPSGKIPYEKVKESIATSLKLEKFKQSLKILSQNLRQSAKITIK